jgi:hypothetical protein
VFHRSYLLAPIGAEPSDPAEQALPSRSASAHERLQRCSDRLELIAARHGLPPWDHGQAPVTGLALASAIQQARALWGPPGSGRMQPGVYAVCGGRPPASLLGRQLWPVLVQSDSGPALVLTDIRYRIHVVVDVAHTLGGWPPRPRWVPAAAVAHSARLPGSHPLWRRWQFELNDRAPHDWTPSCADHLHLGRPNAQGRLVTGIPQHDVWTMSRSWLPSELRLPSVTDVRWVVLSATDRPIRERESEIRSRWDAVSFAEFAAAALAEHDSEAPLPTSLAAALRMMRPLPVPADAEPGSESERFRFHRRSGRVAVPSLV